MGHKHRADTPGVAAFVAAERAQPWAWVLDGGLVLGIALWFGLRATLDPQPELLAVYSALLVGTIVHRFLSLTDSLTNSSTESRGARG